MRGLLEFLGPELYTHLSKILITRNLKRRIDADSAMHLARSAVIEDRIGPWRRDEAPAAAGELRILITSEESGGHRHGLEGRARNVVGTERAAHQRTIALVGLQSNPGGLVLNSFQTVGRLAVESKNFASLRI